MYLQLSHTKLDIFYQTKLLVIEIYKITKQFPSEEKFGLTHQLRRAAVSVHLNVAEGCSRKSRLERKRFFEIARGSVIEIDTGIDISEELGYCISSQLRIAGDSIISCFRQLSGLVKEASG